MRRRSWLVVAVLSLVALVTGSCTSARNTLGTNASPCFLALPVASAAVHDRGSFAGVLLVTAASLDKRPRHSTTTSAPASGGIRAELQARAQGRLRSVCVVAYSGRYEPAQVEDPVGGVPASGSGRYAVVIVQYPGNRLLGTLIRAQEPLRFHHSRLGG